MLAGGRVPNEALVLFGGTLSGPGPGPSMRGPRRPVMARTSIGEGGGAQIGSARKALCIGAPSLPPTSCEFEYVGGGCSQNGEALLAVKLVGKPK